VLSLVPDGERSPCRDGRRRLRRAVLAVAVGCAPVACSPALAVGPRGTTVSVSCGSGVVVSQPATCTATVTDTAAGTPSTPTGTVSFGSDSEGTFSPSTTCELSPLAGTEQPSSCSVEYDPTKVALGTQEITVAYGGDSGHAESSGSGTLAVGPRGTTVSVSCGSGVVVSQPATCTATVTDTAAGTPSTPTGTVSFGSDASGSSFGLSGICTLIPLASGGQSGCSVEYMPGQGSGAHTITAAYGGDAVHAAGSASGMLAVSAPPIPAPPGDTTTTPVQGTAALPAPPKCRVGARERWRIAGGARRRVRRVKVPVLLISYTCDQNSTVRIGGVVTIAPTSHGRKMTKAQTINLAPVSSSAVLGKADAGVVLALPASVARAVRDGVRTAVAVTFTVKNANGIGVATLKFPLFPFAPAAHRRG
jgi:hypothetical protein